MYCHGMKLLDFLLTTDTNFSIPPFQRNYEWNEEQCGIFFEDLISTYKSNSKGIKIEHFLGTITYSSSTKVAGEYSTFILIDGQQRLTTVMLFLVALRNLLENENDIKTMQRFLLTSGDFGDPIRLKQVEKDWSAYRDIIMHKHDDIPPSMSRVYKNYKWFYTQLKSLKEQNKIANLKDIYTYGLDNFSICTIALDPNVFPWENPQRMNH